jgi:hypothetical protein
MVLGSTTVKDRAARGKVVDAVLGGIRKRATIEEAAACFQPWHGLRAKAGGTVVELVICYECGWVLVEVDGQRQGKLVTKRDPRDVLNEVQTAAKVPLPTRPKSKD